MAQTKAFEYDGDLYLDLDGAMQAADKRLTKHLGSEGAPLGYHWRTGVYMSLDFRGLIHRGTVTISGLHFTVDILERNLS